MFRPGIVHLRQFYASPLGKVARHSIARGIARLWPESPKESILGIGFSMPYLESCLNDAESVIACMPSGQGAMCWPHHDANRTVLAYESSLPFRDGVFNRIVLLHCIEYTEQLRGLMEEAWRVLVPGGRMLIVTPNRLSYWSRNPASPFGYGRPSTLTQLRAFIAEHRFTYTRSTHCLFTPPFNWRWLIRLSPFLEALGLFFCPPVGGVLIVEVEKQIYASVKEPVTPLGYRMPLPVATQPAMTFHVSSPWRGEDRFS